LVLFETKKEHSSLEVELPSERNLFVEIFTRFKSLGAIVDTGSLVRG